METPTPRKEDDCISIAESDHTMLTGLSTYQKQKNFAKVLDNLCKIGMDGVIVISDRGVMLRVNTTVLDMLGYTQDELIHKKLNKLLPQPYRSKHDSYLLRYQSTLCPVILNRVRKDLTILRKSRYHGEPEKNRAIAISLKVTEIVDADEQRYFVGVIKDERIWYKNEVHSKIVQRMYPAPIYKRVMLRETSISGKDDCSIVFVDLVGFTSHCSSLPPNDIVNLVNRFFRIMDRCIGNKGRFIKTIGDCYMYVCGISVCQTEVIKYADHPKRAIDIAIEALKELENFELSARIGICSGVAVYGVFGENIPIFDVFGEVVNLASRMEGLSKPNTITVFGTVKRLTESYFEFNERIVEIKGKKGKFRVYDVLGPKEVENVFDLTLDQL